MSQSSLFSEPSNQTPHQSSSINGPLLTVYPDKSVYVSDTGMRQEFREGAPSEDAKSRLQKIKHTLAAGFVPKLIQDCIDNPQQDLKLDSKHIDVITALVDSITSEVGRGLVALTYLQLTIKAICPEQSVRLHKSGGTGIHFSWCEGVPMRTLDKDFITPKLREFELLKLNEDGIMMTRTLAENYPYTPLYKAVIKGGRKEWLRMLEWIEAGEIGAEDALRLLTSILLNRTSDFKSNVELMLGHVSRILIGSPDFDTVYKLIVDFVNITAYSARVFEVALHSFMQALFETGDMSGHLKPISQMRSANKKHGNIGDVEITNTPGRFDIVEAWDAKYGKPYLRDELEELNDKLIDSTHDAVCVGFITNAEPDLRQDILDRMQEIGSEHNVSVKIMSIHKWVHWQLDGLKVDKDEVGALWLKAFAESIGQKRRHLAPIDEPTNAWVEGMLEMLKNHA